MRLRHVKQKSIHIYFVNPIGTLSGVQLYYAGRLVFVMQCIDR